MKLTITKRDGKTKGEAKQIRRAGNIPAVFYGAGQDVEKVVVPGPAFQAILRNLKQGKLSTLVFELTFGDASHQAVIKDIQYHPATYAIEHVDFMKLNNDRKLTVNVPIQILGLGDCPGVKLGGTLRQVIRTLKVSCLPKDIPNEFTLDVSSLNITDSRRLSDIEMPANVRPLALMNEVAVIIAKGKASA